MVASAKITLEKKVKFEILQANDMKRIAGIILAVLLCVALFVFLIWSGVARGLTLVNSILAVSISIAISLVIVGLIYLTLWLLD